MRLTRLDAARFFGKPSNRLFAAFAARIAVLDQPKRSLRVLRREAHMLAFQRAVDEVAPGKHLAGPGHRCLADRLLLTTRLRIRTGAHVAVFETGTGVLPVLCAAAGARSTTGALEGGVSVVSVERWC
jgi:hypothetical protein